MLRVGPQRADKQGQMLLRRTHAYQVAQEHNALSLLSRDGTELCREVMATAAPQGKNPGVCLGEGAVRKVQMADQREMLRADVLANGGQILTLRSTV
jgi:hypothetical protein